MGLSPEKEEQAKKIVKYLLIAGIGGAAIYNMKKGNKWGHFLRTDSRNFFITVVEDGRDRVRQLSGYFSDIGASEGEEEVEIAIEPHPEFSDDDVEEIASVFIDERDPTPYN